MSLMTVLSKKYIYNGITQGRCVISNYHHHRRRETYTGASTYRAHSDFQGLIIFSWVTFEAPALQVTNTRYKKCLTINNMNPL